MSGCRLRDPAKVSFTYGASPSTSQRDAVRLLIGDIDACDPLLDDREVDYFIAQEGNTISAAYESAVAIAGAYSRMADTSAGNTSESASQKAQAYLELAKTLKAKRGHMAVAPYCGGISHSDKSRDETDSDRVSPFANIRLHDNPAAGSADELEGG